MRGDWADGGMGGVARPHPGPLPRGEGVASGVAGPRLGSLPEGEEAKQAIASRTWWPMAKRVLTIAFFVIVAWLLFMVARHVKWAAVMTALQAYPARVLWAAAAVAATSYVVYSTYDLIGRRETGHTLSTRKVCAVAFISYSFNLNFGSLVGAFATRYRLYLRFGLSPSVITRILAVSLVTNWLGYFAVGGAVFMLHPPPLPPDWSLTTIALRVLGALLLAVATAYVALCFKSKRRVWNIRRLELRLPPGRIALVQLIQASVNWSLIALVVYLLLQHRIDFVTCLGVLLMAAIAGAVAHVPAGLGVLEAVFIALLSSRIPTDELIAALLAYRGIYYIAPLMVSATLFFLVSARTAQLARRSDSQLPDDGGTSA
jgi:uncharacterized membrane protein YbhN (UPF0104 family)